MEIVDALLDSLVAFELIDLGFDPGELAPETFDLLVGELTRLHASNRLSL